MMPTDLGCPICNPFKDGVEQDQEQHTLKTTVYLENYENTLIKLDRIKIAIDGLGKVIGWSAFWIVVCIFVKGFI